MKYYQRIKQRMQQAKEIYAGIIAFALSSLAIACLGLYPYDFNGAKWANILIGAVFWLGLAAGIVFSVLLTKRRKKEGFHQGKVGLISFFQNKIAAVFDILMILTLFSTVLLIIFSVKSAIAYVIVALFFFSLEMHCVLNGKNYKYITSKMEEKKDENG